MDRSKFERVDMRDRDYQTTIEEMRRCTKLCWQINQTEPMTDALHSLVSALFAEPLDVNSNIFPPVQIGYSSAPSRECD